ncbi:MAG: Hsp70 family protein [Planctomycetota bacterium]|nr:Hsp70 family protein [Planctomycetota bacterium]
MKRRGCESVGIDLGTTYSALAYLDAQLVPQVLSDTSGQIATPSVIYFDDAGIVVGEPALQQSKVAAERVAQFIKVHMGDPWQAEFLGHTYTPESLSAIILRHLVREAEPQIGPISRAVITVPAYFTERRRRATEQAGTIAGLEVTGTLNEPMAATLAYGLYRGEGEQTVVVYDLGGGTFDVTAVQITPHEIRELATCGDRKLGGRDWDQALFDFVADDFQRAQKVDLRSDRQAVQELQLECERTKRNLSRFAQFAIRVHAAGKSHVCQVTRQQFEGLTTALLQRTKLTTEMVLEDAGLNWSQISRVVLVGGSTQMPAVRRMLQETCGFSPDSGVHPVAAVAQGAAIYAHLLERGQAPRTFSQTTADEPPVAALPPTPNPPPPETVTAPWPETALTPFRILSDEPGNATVEDEPANLAVEDDPPTSPSLPRVRFVTAHGVGLRTRRGSVSRNNVLIPKNSLVPIESTKRFVTSDMGGGGAFISILVTQGDTRDSELAEVLGQGRIAGFPPGDPPGQAVDVTMRFDEFGRLHIRAVYVRTSQEMQLSLEIPGGLKAGEVERQREHLERTPWLSLFDSDADGAS